jgi:hypothetical protein
MFRCKAHEILRNEAYFYEYVGLVRLSACQLARTPVDQLTRKQANQPTGQQRMRWTFSDSRLDFK